jgi:hypothetical protein
MDVSIIASSVRTQLYNSFFSSLENTTVSYEVVFAGNNPPTEEIKNLRYIKTENIKPAQCYEIARRNATGEVVLWVADDCQFPYDVVGRAFNFWKQNANRKLILSILTRERYDEKYFLTDLDGHRLRGRNTPLMAPIGMMSRQYLDELGGFDRRYICGQYENDVVMRIIEDGGEILKFEECPVVIDHFIGHGGVGTRVGNARPFAMGYPNDRAVLEKSWFDGCMVSQKRLDAVEQYEEDGLYYKTQSNNLELWQ